MFKFSFLKFNPGLGLISTYQTSHKNVNCLFMVYTSIFIVFCEDLISNFLRNACLCFTGGHINPTVTFSLCLLGREPWRKFPVFFLAQTLGAFLGSGIIFGMYIGEFQDFISVVNNPHFSQSTSWVSLLQPKMKLLSL